MTFLQKESAWGGALPGTLPLQLRKPFCKKNQLEAERYYRQSLETHKQTFLQKESAWGGYNIISIGFIRQANLDTELISLFSLLKVTLPLIKINPLPLDPGEDFYTVKKWSPFHLHLNLNYMLFLLQQTVGESRFIVLFRNARRLLRPWWTLLIFNIWFSAGSIRLLRNHHAVI